jgi:hypothetical protein
MAFWVLTQINHGLDDKERAEQQARASAERLASVTTACAGYTFHPREFEACVGHNTLYEHREIYDPPERIRSC